MLLDAGADPNDGQALYNRMFEPDNDHLELLLEYGLGTGDGGPWKARLGDELASPPEMLRAQLDWAVTHDQLARVQLLVGHGVDIHTPDRDDIPQSRSQRCAATRASSTTYSHTAHPLPPSTASTDCSLLSWPAIARGRWRFRPPPSPNSEDNPG